MPLPEHLYTALDGVIRTLYDYQTAAGGGYKRYLSAIFRDLPDRRLYPDYYQIIKEPRCLHDIMESLDRGAYSSPQAVAYDLFLIWANAREYNEQGSLVYADADKLENLMQRYWQDPLPPFHTLPRPGSLPVAGPSSAQPDGGRKIKKIKLTGASVGTPSAPPANIVASGSTKLRIAPPSASPAPSTPSLTLKLGGNRLQSTPSAPAPLATSSLPALPPVPPSGPPALSTGATAPSSSAVTPAPAPSRRPSSSAAIAAATAERKAEKAEKEDGEGEEGAPSAPSVPTFPDVENGWMRDDSAGNPQALLEILTKLRNYTDANGRPLATPLLDLPDRASRPDYYQRISHPISLNEIEDKVKLGAYPSAEAFDRDLHQLFQNVELVTPADSTSTAYSDLVVLQRYYHELTKRRSPLELSSDAQSTAALAGSDFKSRATARPTTKDKVFLDAINFKGDVLRVGDWVHLWNADNPAKPVIAQIWKTYKRSDSPQRGLTVCWYFRPEETVHPASRQFYENEVFKTGVFIDHNIEDFVGRCFVMFYTKYIKGRPKAPVWEPSMPLYVCEHRYKDDVKAFKKIKNWNTCVPEEVRKNEYEFEPYQDDHTDSLGRVKSPFIGGPGAPSNAPAPSYHFLHDGRPATAEEAQASKAAAAAASKAEDAAMMNVDGDGAALAQSFSAPAGSLFDLSSLTAGNTPLSGFDVSAAASPLTSFNPPATTPAELAAATEFFALLPPHIKSKFRQDAFGDLLWFTAPAAEVPTVSRPTHSLEYLYWRARQQKVAQSSA
ncbi:hypothetical protein JCM8547_004051 [Rhodosporidiobolus lusitaniae]